MDKATVRLLVIGLSMAAIFVFAFGGRYTLAQYGNWPLQSLATINRNSLSSAVLYVLSFAALFGLYWLGARLRVTPTRSAWLILGGGAVLFNAVLLPMYPLDAADIYDYIIRGRMSAVYSLNPMRDAPVQVRSDPFYPFAAWREATSAYGPAWEVMAALTSRVAGDDRFVNVIAFKLLACLAYGLIAVLMGLTLHQIAPERAWSGVYLFAWNPLMIYVAGGSGHNDLWLSACVMGSLFLLYQRAYIYAALAAVFGALVKFIPVLLLPIVAIVAWRELHGKRRLPIFALGIALCGLAAVGFFAPFWTGLDSLAIDRRARMFTGSVATLARQALMPALGEDGSGALVRGIALAVFALFFVWQLVELVRSRQDTLKPVRVLTTMLLFYLMVAAIWFQLWYLAWVVPLAALLDDTPVRRLTLLFSYTVTWQPLLYNYVTLRTDGWMPLPWRDLIPVAVVIGIPWIYGCKLIADWLKFRR